MSGRGVGVGGGGSQHKNDSVLFIHCRFSWFLSYLCDCLQLYTPSPTLCWYSHPPDSSSVPDFPLLVPAPFSVVFGPSVWNDLPFPLRQKPPRDSWRHFFSPNLLFSVPWCCLHPSQVWVKSKGAVGNSWTVLKVILGHKYHHNH